MTASMNYGDGDKADSILYRTYYSLMMGDILYKIGYSPTKKNKDYLHDFRKRMFGYKTIAGLSHDQLSKFMFEVCVFWAAEFGIFVRTSARQPWNIEDLPLKEVKHLL